MLTATVGGLLVAAVVYVATHRNLWWPTSVYFVRSRRGRLLYVGKSNNVRLRLAQHARDPRKRGWWPAVDMSKTRTVRFSNRVYASIAEVVAIVCLLPRHNIRWNWSRRYCKTLTSVPRR